MTEPEKKIGMTFTQLLSLIGLLVIFLTGWVAINVRLTEVEIKVEALEINRKENREEHQKILDKLDRLYDLTYERKIDTIKK